MHLLYLSVFLGIDTFGSISSLQKQIQSFNISASVEQLISLLRKNPQVIDFLHCYLLQFTRKSPLKQILRVQESFVQNDRPLILFK